MSRVRVLVLYGGKSTEHEISCRSAAFILRNLDPDLYEVHVVGITKEGRWLVQDHKALLASSTESLAINEHTGDHGPRSLQAMLGLNSLQLPGYTGQPQNLNAIPTVVFPMLHGTNGEDGSIQGMLELAELAYVGADTLASCIGMDKEIAKKLVALEGIAIVPYCSFTANRWHHEAKEILSAAEKKLGWPMFVKPAKLGSSVGVQRVSDAKHLREACEFALGLDDKVLLEKGLNVREIECAVIGDDYEVDVSVPGEIDTGGKFYNYETKYLDENAAKIVIPAALDPYQTETVRQLAKTVFQCLSLQGLARVDFFLSPNEGTFYFNEVNTMPGFTSISQFPMLWQHSGLDGPALLKRLIELALKRHNHRSRLQRSRN